MKITKGKKEAKESKVAKTIEACINNIEKKYGKGLVQFLVGDGVTQEIEVIPTGSLALDYALGVGGIPRGRVVEIFGPESCGKTNLALNVIAEAQKIGLPCGFVDAEHSLSIDMAKGTGVDVEKLLISQPDYGEQALEIVEMLTLSGSLGLIVIDSVAALVPKKELDGEMEDDTVGLQARMMGKALRKLSGAAAKTKTSIIFINQLRAKIGGFSWGNPTDTPGGKALKFFSSVRLDVRATGKIKQKDDVIGNQLKITVKKNKLAPPFRVAETEIRFGKGFSRAGELFNKAVELDILEKKGNTYSFGEEVVGVGKQAAVDYIDDHADLLEKIATEIRKQDES